MFHVGFGTKNREAEIRKIAQSDRTTALILAAVHFEWMLKRTILKMGTSPTKDLRSQLEDVFRISKRHGKDGYKEIWDREVGKRFKNSSLGTVLGKLTKIQNHALDVRGKVIHGNGTVSNASAGEAIDLFLEAGAKLRDFALARGGSLDTRLRARIKPRSAK
jgi:hypothetical protein